MGHARQILEQTNMLEERYKGTSAAKQQFCISTQHYSFAVNAFVELIEKCGGEKYDFSLRETTTYEIIEDVASLKSEIGILFINDFNEPAINMLDENGKMPRTKQALLADAISTCVGAILGTSTATTFVESSSGISEGARTGLASVVTGIMFLLSLVLAPLFIAIPGFATAPALIYVGYLMMSAYAKIDFSDITQAFPSALCAVMIALTYSISNGMAAGMISYTAINIVCGNAKKVSPLIYIIALCFLLKYIFL